MKSKFLSDLSVTKIDKNRWQLQAKLIYQSKILNTTIHVPAGFQTDFESIPKAVWWLYSPGNSNTVKPSVVHDYLCVTRPYFYDSDTVHFIFLEAMTANNVPEIKRYLMYNAVRFFGPKFSGPTLGG